jgi:hypothetical protein
MELGRLAQTWGFAMKCSIVVSLFLAVTAPSYADTNPLVQDVEHICLRPSDQKSHLLIEGDGKTDGGFIIRLFGLQVNGSAHFTKEEWDGVLAALPPRDVAIDSDSYRKCVEHLVPIFMSKYKESGLPSNNIEAGHGEISVNGNYNNTTKIDGGSGNIVTNNITKN